MLKDHDAKLLKLLDRYRDRNFLTPEGVKPDPWKVDAILKMERPNDVAAVRRLAGLVNYLSKFLSKLSELFEPLRRLTHKDVE